MGRLIVVSNRVAPITEGKPASGGLAVGVMDALKAIGGIWFGWSGEIASTASNKPTLVEQGPVTFATVNLGRQDYDQYYRGFSNATLWPTFHYRVGLSRYERIEYTGYRRVNRRFAEQLLPLLTPNCMIWVHDYHLIPLAEALRDRQMKNRMGFFLHTPFPAPQILQTIPPHEELVRALFAYDLVGFQTVTDLQGFTDYVTRYAGGRSLSGGYLEAFGRRIKTAVYPIGVYPDEIRQQAVATLGRRQSQRLREGLGSRKLLMSVDRLDYAKGLLERFRSFERMLETFPQHQNRVSFMQIAPPSRADVQTYRQIRYELEAEAGRINGRFGDLDWTPLRYLNKGYARPILMSLFAVANVGFVTPLRDGMNLVAKEYVSAQDPENPGVLVLSQFAGAARELESALLVNPFDSDGIAEALNRALSMPLEERRERYANMISVLKRNNLSVWRDRFLADLQKA